MKKTILLIAIIAVAMSCQKEIEWSQQEISELNCVPPTFRQDPTIIGHTHSGQDNGALYIFPDPDDKSIPKKDAPFIYSLDGGKTFSDSTVKPDAFGNFSITNLKAGKYQICIRNKKGCTSSVYEVEIEKR